MTTLESILGLKQTSLHLPKLDVFYFEYQKEDKTVIIFPTLHDQVLFSQHGWQIIKDVQPSHIMLELPEELENQLTEAIDRLPLVSVLHNGTLESIGDRTLTPNPSQAYIIHPGESLYWLGFVGRKNGIPVEFIDFWHPKAQQSWHVPLDYPALASIGWKKFWYSGGAKITLDHIEDDLHRARSLYMASRVLEQVDHIEGSLLVCCGAAHWPIIAKQLIDDGFEIVGNNPIPKGVNTLLNEISWAGKPNISIPEWFLADIHPHTIHLVTTDLPFMLGKFFMQPDRFDYFETIRHLYFEAEIVYNDKFDDQVSPASFRRLFQFLRNLGRIQGRLLPTLFNFIAAAKGMVDDDYAFEVYRSAISYPFMPKDNQKLDEMIKFVPNEDQGEVIKFAFKRRFKRPVFKKVEIDEYEDLDPIPEEDYPGQWHEIWDDNQPWNVVSYPPEDEFIERYMEYLRQRIKEILMEEQASSKEFESSLEDGIDWRETMRHYHERKIYVTKYPKQVEEIGALVIQFLEDPYNEAEYSHHTTLFAEHDQESHISVITTQPGNIMVGPGITRVKYAAIISQFPPLGMPYLISRENIDIKLRLIYSAMQMSLTRIIGFVAKKPPTAAQRHFATENGFRLIYLPMEQLTKSSLHRLRTMHLLAHRDLRDQAREYIGF